MKKAEMVGDEDKTGRDEGRFMFVGEMLALDLVNTEVIVRGKWRDELKMGEDVKTWWEDARRHHPAIEQVRGDVEVNTAYDGELLSALKGLRAALRHIFGALVEGGEPMDADLRVLNDVLQTGYHALERGEDGDLLGVYRTHDKVKGEILLPIALSALHLIQDSERKRLHKCDNERCILYFYDTTKSATRRWCSPGCMDRARSAQRYKQAKERNMLNE